MQLPDRLAIASPNAIPELLWGGYFDLLTYCPSSSRHTRRIIANALLQLDCSIPRVKPKHQANRDALRFLAPYRISCRYEEFED